MPPPSRCLHTLSRRGLDSALPTRCPRTLAVSSFPITLPHQHQQTRHASAGPPKGVKTLRLKKKGRPEKTARPPEPGDRKAQRKRIVLSNTNALSVRDVAPLALEMEALDGPKVQAIPPEVIDQLRAVEAFKPRQGWAYFQTPSVLVRKEAQMLGVDMDAITGKVEVDGASEAKGTTRRTVVVGEKGSGKSVYLLQAMAMAFQRGWVVINLPEASELANAHTAFAPLPNSPLYTQPAYTASLLTQTLAANKAVLSALPLSKDRKLPFPINKEKPTLADLLALASSDANRSWQLFQIFWDELNLAGAERPPVLLCLDNMSHVMQHSEYQILNSQGKLEKIHAHDLTLVKHFMQYLSGTSSFTNGGVVLAATSASDAPKSNAMEVGIAITETRQNLARSPSSSGGDKTANEGSKPLSPYETAYTRLQRLNPSRDANPTALSNFWSPFQEIDKRVLDVFTPPSSPSSSTAKSPSSLQVLRLPGLTTHESVALMKYWTRSGMNRGAVLPWTVQEARALSGGGVVGELERTVVRFLQREQARVEGGEPGGGKIRVH